MSPPPSVSQAATPEALLEGLAASNLFDLKGLVAVVTGGASGIGLMVTTALLANGATVHIVDLDSKQLQSILNTYGSSAEGRIFGHQGDVSQKAEAKRIAEEVGKLTPYVTVLFNNAGIVRRAIPIPYTSTEPEDYVAVFDQYDESSFLKVFSVNVWAPFFFATAFLPLLCAARGGRFPPQIINTCSVMGYAKDISVAWGLLAYTLSKGAVEQLTKILAHSLINLGIRVNGFAPGTFQTAHKRTVLGFSDPPPAHFVGEEADGLPGVKIPVRHFGRNEDIGAVAIMLVTNQYMTGEVVCVDGGMLLRMPASH
ncbi:NAD(P)-binding protein [Auricularia subglabra TFB-10046 SS5]|uniref:NAD(P)-binding protein n=1 Tax=Auricularia subglabra (strain TFB-10046 / SS5) TaxID=717982 RepID=J0WRA2_AURST|nr:NAD(P)-binding protein [Auricularia subglabra TFB-10046 SS5]